jgi:predicted nucleic acid-binding protein
VKRILLASNVVLNVFLDREPHYEASAALFDAIKAGSAEGFVSAHAVTTIHY